MSWADKAESKINAAIMVSSKPGGTGSEGSWEEMGKWKKRALLLARKFEDYRKNSTDALNGLSNENDRLRASQAELIEEIGRLRTDPYQIAFNKALLAVEAAGEKESIEVLSMFVDELDKVKVQNKVPILAYVGSGMSRKLQAMVKRGPGGLDLCCFDGFKIMDVVVIRDPEMLENDIKVVSNPP